MMIVQPAINNSELSRTQQQELGAVLGTSKPKTQFQIENENLLAIASGANVAQTGIIGADKAEKERENARRREGEAARATFDALGHLYAELEKLNEDIKAAEEEYELALKKEMDQLAITQQEGFDLFETLDELKAVASELENAGYIMVSDIQGDKHVVFQGTDGGYYIHENGQSVPVTDDAQLAAIEAQLGMEGKHLANPDEIQSNALIVKQQALYKQLDMHEDNSFASDAQQQVLGKETDKAEGKVNGLKDERTVLKSKIAVQEELQDKDSENEEINDIGAPKPDEDMMLFAERKSEIGAIIDYNGGTISDYELENILREYGINPAKLETIKQNLSDSYGFELENMQRKEIALENTPAITPSPSMNTPLS